MEDVGPFTPHELQGGEPLARHECPECLEVVVELCKAPGAAGREHQVPRSTVRACGRNGGIELLAPPAECGKGPRHELVGGRLVARLHRRERRLVHAAGRTHRDPHLADARREPVLAVAVRLTEDDAVAMVA